MEKSPIKADNPRRSKRQLVTWPKNTGEKKKLEEKEYISTKRDCNTSCQNGNLCKETYKLKCFTVPESEKITILRRMMS